MDTYLEWLRHNLTAMMSHPHVTPAARSQIAQGAAVYLTRVVDVEQRIIIDEVVT